MASTSFSTRTGGPAKPATSRAYAATTAAVFVATYPDRTVGFVAIVCHENPSIGEIDMLAVDPDYQLRGIGSALTTFALDHMRSLGIRLASIATSGDPGHAAARRTYEKAGLVALPLVRYYTVLDS